MATLDVPWQYALSGVHAGLTWWAFATPKSSEPWQYALPGVHAGLTWWAYATLQVK